MKVGTNATYLVNEYNGWYLAAMQELNVNNI